MSTGRQRVPSPMLPGSLRDLRHWACAWMKENDSAADADSVVLVLTEMVTNSVRHGAAPISVDLVQKGHALVVGVSDGSSDPPTRPDIGTADEGGRGLAILDALTSRWGVWLNPSGGKTVWCELATSGHASTRRASHGFTAP